MAAKRNAFEVQREALPPMTACAGPGCGHEGGHEGELFALALDGKWYCHKCFFSGPGRTWPRKRARVKR